MALNVSIVVVQPVVTVVIDGAPAVLIPSVDATTVNGVTPGTTGLAVLATETAAAARAVLGVTDTTTTLASALAQSVRQSEVMPNGPTTRLSVFPSSFASFPAAQLPLQIVQPLVYTAPIQG
jgi:hypothetical protein